MFLLGVWLWLCRAPPRSTFRPHVTVVGCVIRMILRIIANGVHALTYWCYITSVGTPLPAPTPPEPCRLYIRNRKRVKGYERHKWHLAHMHWVCIVLVTLVHKQTTEYQYAAQGTQLAAPHVPQWVKSAVCIPVHMLWDGGARLRKLSSDIHPLSGPPPPPPGSIRFVTLHVGGPILSRRRWGRLLQEVTAIEPTIVGLQEFRSRSGDNHLAWLASMAKNYIPVSYSNHNPDTMFLIHESVYKYATILQPYPGRKGLGLAIQLALPYIPPLVIINIHGPFEKAQQHAMDKWLSTFNRVNIVMVIGRKFSLAGAHSVDGRPLFPCPPCMPPSHGVRKGSVGWL